MVAILHGQQDMDLMILEAKRKNLEKVFLKASLNAKSFYEKLGFRIVNSHIDQKPPEGIPNYIMEMKLE